MSASLVLEVRSDRNYVVFLQRSSTSSVETEIRKAFASLGTSVEVVYTDGSIYAAIERE